MIEIFLKPKILQAEVFTSQNWKKLLEFTNNSVFDFMQAGTEVKCKLRTRFGGITHVNEGDYVIKDEKGYFWNISLEDLKKHYTIVDHCEYSGCY